MSSACAGFLSHPSTTSRDALSARRRIQTCIAPVPRLPAVDGKAACRIPWKPAAACHDVLALAHRLCTSSWTAPWSDPLTRHDAMASYSSHPQCRPGYSGAVGFQVLFTWSRHICDGWGSVDIRFRGGRAYLRPERHPRPGGQRRFAGTTVAMARGSFPAARRMLHWCVRVPPWGCVGERASHHMGLNPVGDPLRQNRRDPPLPSRLPPQRRHRCDERFLSAASRQDEAGQPGRIRCRGAGTCSVIKRPTGPARAPARHDGPAFGFSR
jgi:hypothetical protein